MFEKQGCFYASCTTLLFMVNMSMIFPFTPFQPRNSFKMVIDCPFLDRSASFGILSESGDKGKPFFLSHQTYLKIYFEKKI